MFYIAKHGITPKKAENCFYRFIQPQKKLPYHKSTKNPRATGCVTFEEGTTWEFDNDQAILPSGIELIQIIKLMKNIFHFSAAI